MNTYQATLPALLAVLLIFSACGGPEAQADEAPDGAVSSSIHFNEGSIKDSACEILTAEMVADAAGVPVGDITQFSPWASLCEYSWDPQNKITLSGISVAADAQTAHNHFDAAYSEYTTEQMAEGQQALDSELQRQAATGEIPSGDAAAAAGLAGLFAGMAASTSYDQVSGIGDRAVYDGTVRTMSMPVIGEIVTAESKAYVLLGNLSFSLEGHLTPPGGSRDVKEAPSQEELTANREFTLEMARRVTERLREM